MTPEEFITQCQTCVQSGGGAAQIAGIVRATLPWQARDPAWRHLPEFMSRSPELLIVNLTLAPHATTPVHDHGMWAVVGISSGCEIDRFFEREGQALRLVEELSVGAGEAIGLEARAIHSIFNPLASEARGIHVYGGDMVSAPRRMWNPHTGQEEPYEGNVFERWCTELTDKAASIKDGI